MPRLTANQSGLVVVGVWLVRDKGCSFDVAVGCLSDFSSLVGFVIVIVVVVLVLSSPLLPGAGTRYRSRPQQSSMLVSPSLIIVDTATDN